MYTKNPITEKLESFAYKSDIARLLARLNKVSGTTGDESEIILEANAALSSAATAESKHATAQADMANATNFLEQYETSRQAAATEIDTIEKGDGTNLGYATITAKSNAAKTKATGTVTTKNNTNAANLKRLVKCFVNHTVRIADLDLLHGIGTMANTVDKTAYKYAACENADDLWAADGHAGEINAYFFNGDTEGKYDKNLMSLNDTTNCYTHDGMSADVTVWNSDLPSLTQDKATMFAHGPLIEFNGELPNLKSGNRMFHECTSLTAFNHELPSLTDGTHMFGNCGENITVYWEGPTSMPHLINGEEMFSRSPNLRSLNIALPELECGKGMFNWCSSFVNGPTSLPKLR